MLTAPYHRVALAVLLLVPACSPRLDPVRVRENVVIIQNQTSRDWRNVIITVNDHFRGGAPLLAAGGQLTAPLTQFQTAFGQRYDFSRQKVFKVEVIATDSNGAPVQLQLDNGPLFLKKR
jgi:hypothetical protein